jgi:hypothetical protein
MMRIGCLALFFVMLMQVNSAEGALGRRMVRRPCATSVHRCTQVRKGSNRGVRSTCPSTRRYQHVCSVRDCCQPIRQPSCCHGSYWTPCRDFHSDQGAQTGYSGMGWSPDAAAESQGEASMAPGDVDTGNIGGSN